MKPVSLLIISYMIQTHTNSLLLLNTTDMYLMFVWMSHHLYHVTHWTLIHVYYLWCLEMRDSLISPLQTMWLVSQLGWLCPPPPWWPLSAQTQWPPSTMMTTLTILTFLSAPSATTSTPQTATTLGWVSKLSDQLPFPESEAEISY